MKAKIKGDIEYKKRWENSYVESAKSLVASFETK